MSLVSAHTQWYRCDSRIGELAVGIDVGSAGLQDMQGPRLLLQQAMLLSEVELTLQAFELWQDLDLDLVPVAEQAGCNMPGTEPTDNEVELLITHGSLPAYLPTRFRFAKQALPQMAAVNEQLEQSLELQWSSLPVSITLDRFNLQECELKKICAGATVLLPASFQAPWQTRLSVPGIDGLAFTTLLDPTQKQVTLYPAAEQTGEDPSINHTTVQLIDALSISPAQVLGDVSGRTIELFNRGAALAGLVIVNNKPLAQGAIGEVGRGYAVYVSRVLTEEQAIWN